MSRTRKIAVGLLVALLAATPFLPGGHDAEPDVVTSGESGRGLPAPAGSVGPGEVTPAMRAEIDRVVDAGLAVGRMTGKVAPETLARALVRCAEFDGQRYCLNAGWTEQRPDDVRARLATAARAVADRDAVHPETTGDLDALALLRRSARLDPDERAAAERRELTAAARAVSKVWLLRHEIEGAALPTGYLARHPEVTTTARTQRTKTHGDYPRRDVVLRAKHVRDQRRTYWCGPGTTQMIAWAWQNRRRSQRHWDHELGTTTDGTGISDMTRVINQKTGYDRDSRAGKYIVLDISHWNFGKWLLLNMRHVTDYRAPLVLHPVLLKRFYPYLDDDASGHFQVGRGYDKRGRKPAQISYFEPWNQQRFDPSEPFIGRVQWRSAYKSYRANKAHFQQNIGV